MQLFQGIMAKRIEGDLVIKTGRLKKPIFPDEWFDGTQWELTWGWREESGEYDIPGTVSSPDAKLRQAAKRHGKKLHITKVSREPWVFRIQAY